MRPNDVRALLDRRPIQPFRLFVLEVTSFEIRHPELAIVNPSTITLHFPSADETPPLVERYVIIALLHISRLELIQ